MENDQKKIAEAFGLAVKVERVRHRLSQEELAHKADLNTSYLSRTERGLSQPTLWTITKLAVALQLHPAKLVELALQNADVKNISPLGLDSLAALSASLGQQQARP